MSKSIKTSAGKITTKFYDDITTKGVEISLDGVIVVSLNVNKEGEAQVSVATYAGVKRIKINGKE